MKSIIIALSLFVTLLSAKEIVEIYNIEGMMCGMSCPTKVVNSIIDIDGVKSCDVSFENSKAVITYDDTKINSKKIANTIAKETYYIVELSAEKKSSFWSRLFGK